MSGRHDEYHILLSRLCNTALGYVYWPAAETKQHLPCVRCLLERSNDLARTQAVVPEESHLFEQGPAAAR